MDTPKPFRKLAGPPDSDGLNSCPTVIGFGNDEVILQGRKLDPETRRRLSIPEGEDAVVMPIEIYLRGARSVAESG
jgi:hypothetical protein